MAEMEMGQIEVCEPRSVQVWRGFVSWVGFILQVFIQILRGTPSFFSYLVGLSSSSYSSLLASSSSSASPSFKPLPVVELPLQESSAAAAAHVSFDGGLSDDCGGGDGQEMEKLTVSFVYWFYFKFLNLKKKSLFALFGARKKKNILNSKYLDFVISLGRWLVRQLNGSVIPPKKNEKRALAFLY